MSRSLLFCILLGLSLVCILGVALIGGSRPAAGQPGPRAAATATYGGRALGSGRLTANWPPVSLLPTSAAMPNLAWSDLPVQDDLLLMLQAQHLVGFDAGVLSGWRMAEVSDLMSWQERGIWFEGAWTSDGLRTALQGLQVTLRALDNHLDEMAAVLGTTDQRLLVYQVCEACYETGSHFSQPELGIVTFDSDPDLVSFLHETGHLVDYHLALGLDLDTTWGSDVMLMGLGWHLQVHQSGEAGAYYLDSEQDAPHSEHSPREDFADTFAAWVLEENRQPLPHRWRPPSNRRVLMLSTLPGAMLQ
jgi:hypothetical protein